MSNLMRLRRYIMFLPVILLVLIVAAYIYSWFDSFYDGSSKNLLGAVGIRWSLRNGVQNFASAPIAKVLLLLISCGLLWKSSFPEKIYRLIRRKNVTLKQRRAMSVALSMVGVYVGILVVGIMFPHSILLSVRGTIADSPFIGGMFMFVVFGIALMGTTYGISSGAYRNHVDWIEGAGFLMSRAVSFFITAFLFSELMACVEYMQCEEFVGLCNWYAAYKDWIYYVILMLYII